MHLNTHSSLRSEFPIVIATHVGSAVGSLKLPVVRHHHPTHEAMTMRTKAYSQEATKLQTDGALPTGPGRGWSDLFVCVTTLIILLHCTVTA